MDYILKTKNLNYKDKIKDINIKIIRNKINAFIGNDKSNKETLLRLLCGIFSSNEAISVNCAYMNKSNFDKFNIQFGVVLSNINNQFLFDSVYKELIFPLQNLNMSKRDIINRLNYIVKLFDLEKLLKLSPQDLTYYQKQIVLVAIALMHKPKILFLENVLSFLDYNNFNRVINILKKLCNEDDLTVILTTDISAQTIFCDNLFVIDQGKIVFSGKPIDVYNNDKELIKLGLEIPFIYDLSSKLKFYELITQPYDNIERLV
ncbi:MAG: ATP-binding cassette domain-containing protein, partial [Tenericutes bacterium]|nr:ATP-binding cassette domain-containing protein [Mycoplasmatota bacterium]